MLNKYSRRVGGRPSAVHALESLVVTPSRAIVFVIACSSMLFTLRLGLEYARFAQHAFAATTHVSQAGFAAMSGNSAPEIGAFDDILQGSAFELQADTVTYWENIVKERLKDNPFPKDKLCLAVLARQRTASVLPVILEGMRRAGILHITSTKLLHVSSTELTGMATSLASAYDFRMSSTEPSDGMLAVDDLISQCPTTTSAVLFMSTDYHIVETMTNVLLQLNAAVEMLDAKKAHTVRMSHRNMLPLASEGPVEVMQYHASQRKSGSSPDARYLIEHIALEMNPAATHSNEISVCHESPHMFCMAGAYAAWTSDFPPMVIHREWWLEKMDYVRQMGSLGTPDGFTTPDTQQAIQNGAWSTSTIAQGKGLFRFLTVSEIRQMETNSKRNNGQPALATSVLLGYGVTSRNSGATTEDPSRLAIFATTAATLCPSLNLHHTYNFYFGYDHTDSIYSNSAAQARIEYLLQAEVDKHADHIPPNVVLTVSWKKCDYEKKPAWAQNDAMVLGWQDGMQYGYRSNDDSRYPDRSDWLEVFIDDLQKRSPPNVGVVGPTCLEGNTGILTHDFVHRTHYEIFGFHYPRFFIKWFADDWITFVYGKKYTKKLAAILVRHTELYGQRYDIVGHEGSLHEETKREVAKHHKIFEDWLKSAGSRGSASPGLFHDHGDGGGGAHAHGHGHNHGDADAYVPADWLYEKTSGLEHASTKDAITSLTGAIHSINHYVSALEKVGVEFSQSAIDLSVTPEDDVVSDLFGTRQWAGFMSGGISAVYNDAAKTLSDSRVKRDPTLMTPSQLKSKLQAPGLLDHADVLRLGQMPWTCDMADAIMSLHKFKLAIVHVNTKFAPPVQMNVPFTESFDWFSRQEFYGCTLSYLVHTVAARHSYSLVQLNWDFAVLVHNDLIPKMKEAGFKMYTVESWYAAGYSKRPSVWDKFFFNKHLKHLLTGSPHQRLLNTLLFWKERKDSGELQDIPMQMFIDPMYSTSLHNI
jgi:hypothetical protein